MEEDLTIPIDELGNTEDPLSLPPETIPEDGLDSFITPTVDPAEQTAIDDLSGSVADTEADLVSALFDTQTQGARTAQAEQDAGIPQLSTELTEINNEITGTSLAFRRELERITEQTGLTAAQKNARLGDVGRKQSAQLADLEVIRAARSNTLTNAQSIIARKTELQFADEAKRVENLQFIYDNNKDQLTKLEDRQFQQLLTKENRAFEIAKGEYQNVEGIKMQLVGNAGSQSAPNSVLKAIMASGSVEEAYKAAGSYGMSIADRVNSMKLSELMSTSKGGNLTEKQRTSLSKDKNALKAGSLITVSKLMDLYSEKIKGFGNTPSPEQRKEANTFLNQIISPAMSVAADQGAMTDAEVKQKVDDMGLKGMFKREKITFNAVDTIKEGINTQIDSTLNFVDSAMPGASDNFEVFNSWKVSQLEGDDKTQAIAEQTISTFSDNGFSDDQIIEYYLPQENIESASILLEQGYSLTDIINLLQ